MAAAAPSLTVLQQVYDAIELVPMLDRLAAAGVRRCDINSSYLANVERAGGPTLALAKAAYDLISRVPVAAEQWVRQLPPDALSQWEESWREPASHGELMPALRAFVTVPLGAAPSAALLEQHGWACKAVAGLEARLQAPPDAEAAKASIIALRTFVETEMDQVAGSGGPSGWYTASMPPELHNLMSVFQRAVMFLSYPPYYAAAGRAPPGERPVAAGLTHPGSRERWLFSADFSVKFFKAAQQNGSRSCSLLAEGLQRLTPPLVHVKHLGNVEACAVPLSLQITDFAYQNHGTAPHSRRLPDGRSVRMSGREPDWHMARQQHAKMLGAIDEDSAMSSFIGILLESGRHGRDFWEHRCDTLDVTPVARACSMAVLQAAGLDEAACAEPWLGLRGGAMRVWRAGSSLGRLVLTPTHPCVGQAQHLGDAFVPGQLQALACVVAAVLPGCFPTAAQMPLLQTGALQRRSPYRMDASRRLIRCCACEFLLSLAAVEEGVEPPGRILCTSVCHDSPLDYQGGAEGNLSQRLQHACEAGHFTHTELAWILWPHALSQSAACRLRGLSGRERDAELEQLMGPHMA